MKPSNEAFWWSLFAAGGGLAAIFLPVIIVATGFILPFQGGFDATQFDHLHGTIAWWPVRILLAVVISLTFFHCAHRIRHVIMDFGVRSGTMALAIVCYGAAFAGTVATVMVVFRV